MFSLSLIISYLFIILIPSLSNLYIRLPQMLTVTLEGLSITEHDFPQLIWAAHPFLQKFSKSVLKMGFRDQTWVTST